MPVLAGVIEFGTALVLLLFGVRWLLQGTGRVIAVLPVPRSAWPALLILCFMAPMAILLGAAVLAGEQEMAIGGIVGLQMLLLLPGVGASALRRSVPSTGTCDWCDSLALGGATVLFLLAAVDGNLARWEGVVLLLASVAYLAALSSSNGLQANTGSVSRTDLRLGLMLSVLVRPVTGLVMLAIGSALLVDGASVLARVTGLQSAAAGALLLAGGIVLATLHPRLSAAGTKVARQTGPLPYLAIALLMNTAVVALLSSAPASLRELTFDVRVLVVTTVVVLLVLLGSKPLSRIEAAGLTLVYVTYLATLFEPVYSGIR